MHKQITQFAFAVLAISTSFCAQAQIANGGFENGLSGWTVFGDASTSSPAIAGNAQLLLTTAGLAADEFDSGGNLIGPFNRSGTAAVETGVRGGLEEQAGFAIGAFDPPGDFAVEGSLAQQTFTAAAGQTLSFVWAFGTRDLVGADYAFVVIDGSLSRLAGTADATLSGTGDDLQRTGDHRFSTTLQTSGSHQIAFGVIDVGDSAVRSSLEVDQVQILAVPEPNGIGLSLCGGALLFCLRCRVGRRRSA